MKKLLELFLSNRKEDKEEFQRRFDQVLSEVSNHVAKKENFWIYFFLGSIFTLPNTELKKSLNIEKIEVNVSDDQRTLNLRITTTDGVISRSITIKDDQRGLKANEIEFQIRKENKETKEKKASLIINYDKKQGSVVAGEFIEISKISRQNFDHILDSLDSEGKEDPIERLFRNLIEIYNHHKEKVRGTRSKSLKLKREPEALHQAFIYGFMQMNMEGTIKCLIEFNAGRGTIDLILKAGDVAIIVECKADSKTAEKAIQQMKDRGYFCLDILDKPESIFLVGMNFNKHKKDEVLKVEKYAGGESKGLINILMNKKIGEEKVKENELKEKIKKELEFLCYSKNIGRCDPNSSSDNKNAGSFSALILGEVLQYCNKNNDYSCEAERKKMTKEDKHLYSSDDDTKDSEFTINDTNDISLLKLNIVENIGKDGNTSPKDGDDGIYNITVTITKDDKELKYKIKFPDKNSNKVEVTVEQDNSHAPRARRRSGRNVRDNSSDDYIDSGRIGFSSTDSKSSSQRSGTSPRKPDSSQKNNTQNIDIKKLIQEIKSDENCCLQKILKDYKDFINSEANLQLFLKGLFMNAEMNDGKIVAETEVSAGQAGKIDLLLKFPDGKGMIFELKVCDEEKDIWKKQGEAWDQLEKYTDKGNLKYIFGPGKSHLVSVVFCKENAECIVKTQDLKVQDDLEGSIDSGIGSSSNSSLSGNSLELSDNSFELRPGTFLTSTPLPSSGINKRKATPSLSSTP